MNIYEKMLAITKEAQNIEKKGYNSYSKYKYVRAVDVIEKIQALLVKHKVYISISEIGSNRESHGKNFHTTIECKATFINAEDPKEMIDVNYFSVSADTLDKDIFKAKTNGLKYLLTQQFMLVTDLIIDTEEDKQQIQQVEKNFEKHFPKQKYSKDTYGVCVTCDGWMHLARSGKSIYCENFKDGGEHPTLSYKGQNKIPDHIISSKDAKKLAREWVATSKPKNITQDNIPF